MSNYLTETIAIAELIFLLPSIVFGVIVNLFKHFILGKKVDETDKGYKTSYYIFSLVVWLLFGAWAIYQNQFSYITYVYACPSDAGSKCYKVVADYVPEDCEDTGWDKFGAHGGRCTDPYIEKIYFDNGSYITFEYCEMERKDKWTCYQEEDSNVWKLELSEKVKVKK